MNLDIHTFVLTATILALLGTVISFFRGIAALRNAPRIRFFRLRQEKLKQGWRSIFFTLVLSGTAFALYNYAEPTIYTFYSPTSTPTPTPSVTPIPTITPSPTITLTPSISPTPENTYTPSPTPTAHLPLAIEAQFVSSVTPNPDAVFSPLQFAQAIDALNQPIHPQDIFQNPVGHLYATFTYDGMVIGSQWTALWYRGGDLVYFETKPWDGGTGGYGYADWYPPAEAWLPGEYTVIIFVGTEWKVAGSFTVVGEIPTPTATSTWTPTPTPTSTPSPTLTLAPTWTPTSTATRWPTATPITPSPTNTRAPTATQITPTPTSTRWPTSTPAP